MTIQSFTGIHIPVITCFDANNQFNPDAQKQLIDYAIDVQDADGIVACATTGEGVLLSEAEYWAVADCVLTHTRARNPKLTVTLGTSDFNPEVTIARHQRAKEMGFDGVLVTHPPYLKPDQAGMTAFFEYLVKSVPDLPIIIYNIWYRTGGNGINPDTLIQLSKLKDIVAVKDAGVSVEHIREVTAGINPDEFAYLCGEDGMYYTSLKHGGVGSISATAHLKGKDMKTMLTHAHNKEWQQAEAIQQAITPMIEALFSAPNPGPLKAAFELLGIAAGNPRLPILPVGDGVKTRLKAQIQYLK